MTRKYLAITALLLAPLAANATTWNLSSSVPAGIKSISAYSVANYATSTFSSATWNNYSGYGLGVTTSGEDPNSPQHATDNNGNIEALLFRFDASTILDRLSIGWPTTTSTDSDISVLRYTGTLTNDALPGDRDIAGDKISDLIVKGWEVVGSYNTAQSTPEDINPNNLSSSFWLISAYSSRWGGAGLGESNVDGGNDYFKLTQLVGTTGTSGGGGGGGVGSVPEPTSLLLLASGMLGWRMNRKSQTIAA